MHTAYVAVGLLTAFLNTFSGIASMVRIRALKQPMARNGVPESWQVFPIGVLKAAGAVGVLLGVVGVPLVGTAAAAGLVLFFSCAVHTHLLSRDHSGTFVLALGYLGLAATTLTLDLAG